MSALRMRIPDDVELVKTAEPARWALERMSSDEPAQWTLSRFMPGGFDGYVRILHPLGGRGGGGASWPWRDFARPGAIPVAANARLRDVVGPDADDERWLDEFGPMEGSLSQTTYLRLISVLRSFTTRPDRGWMAVWDGWGTWWPSVSLDVPLDADPSELKRVRTEGFRRAWERLEQIARATADIEFIQRPWGRRYFLFRTSIDDAPMFHRYTAQLWWPDDRRWFVSTEIDGHSTYVGAPRPCLDAITSSGLFEALEVPWDVPMD
jgi:hypothetical protein